VLNSNRLHRWLGYALLLLSLGHGASQTVYLTTLEIPFTEALFGTESDLVRSMRSTMYEFVTEDESIDVVAQWIEEGRSREGFDQRIRPIMKDDCTKCHSTSSTQTYAIQSLPLVSYDDVVSLSYQGAASRQFRINMTGLVLLTIFVAITLFALPVLRHRYHHLFQNAHRLGYLALPLLLLHVPAWEWLLAPMALLLLDKVVQQARARRGCPVSISYLDRHTLLLRITVKLPVSPLPGDYVRLRCRELSHSQWHPFSIVSYEHDTLILKVAICGDWTKELANMAGNVGIEMDLRGPYPSPASQSTHDRKQRLLVAGGIGVTPYWQWLSAGSGRKTTLVWVLADSTRLEWLKPVIEKRPEADIRLYLTGQQEPLPDWLMAASQVSTEFGRPCWSSLASEFSKQMPGDCYLCGPASLMTQAGRAFRGYRWNVFKETF